MKLHKLVGDTDTDYKYMITLDYDIVQYEDIRIWLIENRIKCSIVPGALYLRSDQDAAQFLLRWT